MTTAVYVLCALTSVACAALLLRAYAASPTRLLLWSSVCFAFLAVNNVVLVVDLSLWESADLSDVRSVSGSASM